MIWWKGAFNVTKRDSWRGGTGHNDSDVAGSVWPQWGNIPSTEGVWGWATSQWATPPSALAYTLHFKEGSIYQLPKCIFYTYRSSHAGELCDFIELLNVMHICSPAFEFACFFDCFFLNNYFFGIPLFPSWHLQVDNTWILYVAVYSWSLQSTLTGKPLLENANRVAIQSGASIWVNSMKPTEAELYHSLGDGENEWKVLVL